MDARTWACALALAAGCLLGPLPDATLRAEDGAQAPGGNAALMERWGAERRLIRDEVLDHLRSQGRLPADGTVTFTAKAAPDPDRHDHLRISVESLEIFPSSGTPDAGTPDADDPARDMARAFAPLDISRHVALEGLDVPVGGTVRETVTMKEGRPVFADPPAEQGK
ncbi:hypothetical protein [Desulfolutivibrio sp.]|uniref:hypothetical protein n=1 Tax=Desulfolutivibrio sp. TaxID=2773296 RepID=UPI002F963378